LHASLSLHRIPTGRKQGGMWPFSKRRLASDQDLVDLVFKLRARVTALEERADASEAAQERLRGRLYATGQHKPPQEPRELSKAEILNRHFTPGRPVNHS